MATVTFPAPAAAPVGRGMSGSEENLVTSTDDDSGEEESRLPVLHGTLNKWTNYLHGWQERYLVLRDGTLSYFKSASELKFGCRGAIRLVNANIIPHKYDVCRFEVSLSDSIWYLRASNEDERQRWVDVLELHRSAVSSAVAVAIAESGYGSENNLRRHNSLISIASAASLSTASASSMKRGFGLKEKLLEMETFKDILNKQVDNLQAYFDSCAALVQDSVHDLPLEDEEPEDEGDETDVVEREKENEEMAEIDEERMRSAAPQRTGFLSRFLPFGRTTGSPGPANTQTPPVVVQPVVDEPSPVGSPSLPSTQPSPSAAPSRQASVQSAGESTRIRELHQILRDHGALALDFKGNSYTFKATTTGILSNLGHCIELMLQREEHWRRRLERETERRRRAEEAYRALLAACANGDAASVIGAAQRGSGVAGGYAGTAGAETARAAAAAAAEATNTKLVVLGGPDLEEGPGCSLGEEEFFDAVDAQLDKMAEAEERADALVRAADSLKQVGEEEGAEPIPLSHPLHDEIEEWVKRQYELADLDLKNLQGWVLLHENGEMRMFKKLEEENGEGEHSGSPLSPLKAVHTVTGITAKEVCRFFWDVRYRREWESTLDQAPLVLELPGRQTVVVHQVYRRVWPATQRDACFWSHMRRIVDPERGEFWMVINRSTDYKAPDRDPSRMLRLWLNVAMVCQTVLPGGSRTDGARLQRDQVRCKIQYTATLDPGGWVPRTAAKAIYEREYPKFLNRFSDYVYERCKGEPVDV